MALINNLYVQVTDESWDRSLDSTSHPVEKGLPITDTIKNKPIELSLSGNIVNVGNMKASEILSKLQDLKNKGSLINYSGRGTAANLQIQSFNTSHPNTIWGGCEFDMSLKEVRIAKKAYTPIQAASPAKTSTTISAADIKVGSIVVFKGGNVYVSSDATKAASTRGRSTCKCTKISNASYSVHKYHLISTDGGNVYGWVDLANIESSANTSNTNATTKSGTQQVQNGSGTAVYHTVKKGDTVWALVNKNYKELGKSVQWVIDNNPSAFSRKGDPKTLQIGAKLLMGYKS